jgi:hypothetical protein
MQAHSRGLLFLYNLFFGAVVDGNSLTNKEIEITLNWRDTFYLSS